MVSPGRCTQIHGFHEDVSQLALPPCTVGPAELNIPGSRFFCLRPAGHTHTRGGGGGGGSPSEDPKRFKRFNRLGWLERFGQLPAGLSQIPSWARRVPYQAVRTVRLDNKEGELVPQTRTAWL